MIGTILTGLCTALSKSVIGWFKNSIEDGVIQEVEWKQLGISVLVTTGIYFVAYYGLNAAGVDYTELISIGAAFIISSIWDSVKKRLNAKNKIVITATKKKKK